MISTLVCSNTDDCAVLDADFQFFFPVELSGYLAAPGGLEVIARESSIHLKWTPPFTLDGVRILGYFLAFTDITEIDGSTTNIVHLSYTETEKNLTTVSLLPCHRYQFLVWALNEVGNGTLSDEMNASFQSGK